MGKAALVLPSLALVACASVASGPHGTYLDSAGQSSPAAARAAKLEVSAREIPEMSSRYFGEIEVTLENPTAEWVRVSKVGLDFGSPKINEAVYLPWGSQLDDWLEATRQRNAIEQENAAMVLMGLGLGASMVSAAAPAGTPGLRVAGGLATLGAWAGAVALASGGPAAGPDGPVFVGRHLLALPIDVPPGLFVKRFIVVNTPADPGLGCLAKMIVSYELADQTTHRVAVGFRGADASRGASQWQAGVCPRGEP